MRTANPYLNFHGTAEEAFNYYRSVFDEAFSEVVRFEDFDGNPMDIPETQLEKIAHIALPIGNTVLMGGDDIERMNGSNTSGSDYVIRVEPESGEEAEEVYGALAEGGETVMPLATVDWAEKHGWCVDQFGVRWMIDYPGKFAE